MGIQLTMRRILFRIFVHRISTVSSVKASNKNTSRLKVIILLLLFISGVELNPGPSFICKYCNVTLNSILQYVRHLMTHAENSKFSFECPLSSCKINFCTPIALQNHLYRLHGNKPNPTLFPKLEESFICKNEFCNQICLDMEEMVRHIRSHLNEVGSVVQCPHTNCFKIFRSKNAFNIHLSRKHPKKYAQVRECNMTEPSNSFDLVRNEECVFDDANESVEDCQIIDLREIIMKFYLKVETEYLLPTSTVTKISNSLHNLLELSHTNLKNFLSFELHRLGIEKETVESILNKFSQTDQLYMMHCGDPKLPIINTNYQRFATYKSYFQFVEPIQFVLGSKDGKPIYGYHVPLTLTLNVLLSKKVVSDAIDKKEISNRCILTDFKDGLVFQNHEVLSKKKCIYLFVYQDAFELVNPLGSAKNTQKVIGMYFSIGNVHPRYRSKLDSLYLIMLIKEKDFFYFGQEKCFKYLIQELKDLESSGIFFKGERIPVVVASILGDNLGSHYIGGFLENFSGQHFCRYCPITKNNFLAKPYLSHELRTINQYEQCIRKIEVSDLILYKGIKCNSIFNQLKHYHVMTPGLPPCLAHDLFEGIVPLDMSLMIKYFVRDKKWFTATLFNKRLKNHSFKPPENSNKPAGINLKTFRLSGHAVQNWYFLRFFSIMIGDKIIDKDDKVWQLYLLLKTICEFICAPAICIEQVAYLQVLIEEYLECRSFLFPDEILKPKHHFLSHYPQLIFQFGPLIRLWTLRYESKHSYFKKCARTCNNFINITKSLTIKHQLKFAYLTCSENLYPYDVLLGDSVPLSSSLELNFFPQKTSKLNKVTINGFSYTKGMCLVLSGTLRELKVGIIFSIGLHSNSILFLVEINQAILDDSLRIYKLQSDSVKKYDLFYFDKIESFSYEPLQIYSFLDSKCIILKYSYPLL